MLAACFSVVFIGWRAASYKRPLLLHSMFRVCDESVRQNAVCQTIDKIGQFHLPIKSANKNLSSIMQKSAEFVYH